MDMQTTVQINADIPQEWYEQWLAYFATVDALFAIGVIILSLWVGRVITTFFAHDKRILLLADVAFGLVSGMFAGYAFLDSSKAGFAIAAILFLVLAGVVIWLSRENAKPWQKHAALFMQGVIK